MIELKKVETSKIKGGDACDRYQRRLDRLEFGGDRWSRNLMKAFESGCDVIVF